MSDRIVNNWHFGESDFFTKPLASGEAHDLRSVERTRNVAHSCGVVVDPLDFARVNVVIERVGDLRAGVVTDLESDLTFANQVDWRVVGRVVLFFHDDLTFFEFLFLEVAQDHLLDLYVFVNYVGQVVPEEYQSPVL